MAILSWFNFASSINTHWLITCWCLVEWQSGKIILIFLGIMGGVYECFTISGFLKITESVAVLTCLMLHRIGYLGKQVCKENNQQNGSFWNAYSISINPVLFHLFILVVFMWILQKLLGLSSTLVTSFCTQLWKLGHGLLWEAHRVEGKHSQSHCLNHWIISDVHCPQWVRWVF